MTPASSGRSAFTVGILSIVGALSFSALFVHATNRTLGAERATIFVRLEAADGLQRGDAVLLRGVNVGEVRALEFDGHTVVARIRLLRAVPLTGRARAEMVAADMFGRQVIVLRPGAPGPPLADGDTLEGRGPVSLTGRIERLGAHADRLLSDTTIDLIQGALGGLSLAAGGASSTMDGLGSLVGNADRLIAEQRESLGTLTRESALLARQLRETAAAPGMTALPDHLEASAANLVAATGSLDSAAASLAGILADLRAGRGNAGLMLRDTTLYARTTGALASLELLLDDLRAHPKRYINVSVF